VARSCRPTTRLARHADAGRANRLKTVGIIGGIGPESTIEYRFLIAEYQARVPDEGYPPLPINSIDLTKPGLVAEMLS